MNVLVLPSPPVSWTFHLIMSHSVALSFALCVPVLPFPSMNPSPRSECFVSVLASAQLDWKMVMMMVPAASPLLAVGAHGHFCNRSNSCSDRSRTLAFFHVSQCSSRLHPTCFRVRSRSGTAAASRCCSQSSSRSRSSDAYADVQMDLGPGASHSLTSNSLPRHSKESLELSPNHWSRTFPRVARGATISLFESHFSGGMIHSSVIGASPIQIPWPHL